MLELGNSLTLVFCISITIYTIGINLSCVFESKMECCVGFLNTTSVKEGCPCRDFFFNLVAFYKYSGGGDVLFHDGSKKAKNSKYSKSDDFHLRLSIFIYRQVSNIRRTLVGN